MTIEQSKFPASLIEQVRKYRAENKRAGRYKIASEFALTVQEARQILRLLGVKDRAKGENRTTVEPKVTTLDGDLQAARVAAKQREAEQSTQRYKQLLQRVAIERELSDVFTQACADAISSGQLNINIDAPKLIPRSGSDEEAALVISDSHAGKEIEPRHTLGFGHYNARIFLDRLAFIESTVASLIQNNITSPITRLHILFLGDLIEGCLNHAEEIPNRLLVVDQIMIASFAFYQFIARLSRVVPEVVVRGLGGNHARWPNQKKVPTANRYSNFDQIVLGNVAGMLFAGGPDNVKMHLEEGAFQVFDILGWRFKIGHGDHLKGGDKALGIAAHAIGREINATTQRYNSIGEKAPDYYIVGDKHRRLLTETATGAYLVNGAFFADDEYALSSNFPPTRPKQLFFGIHKTHGQTWTYPLGLHHAPALEELPYTMPEVLKGKL
jgi:hypothetical protein